MKVLVAMDDQSSANLLLRIRLDLIEHRSLFDYPATEISKTQLCPSSIRTHHQLKRNTDGITEKKRKERKEKEHWSNYQPKEVLVELQIVALFHSQM